MPNPSREAPPRASRMVTGRVGVVGGLGVPRFAGESERLAVGLERDWLLIQRRVDGKGFVSVGAFNRKVGGGVGGGWVGGRAPDSPSDCGVGGGGVGGWG